jgi:SAM-dependent methyltransferase
MSEDVGAADPLLFPSRGARPVAVYYPVSQMAGSKDEVSRFWEKQAPVYNAAPRSRSREQEPRHLFAARELEANLGGRILCVGGLWVGAGADFVAGHDVTVLDVSAAMLSHFEARGATPVEGDARSMPFSDGEFDHVVFPLVIHHITDGSAELSRANTLRALAEARRVLRSDGSVWIREITTTRLTYWAELLLAPATRWALARRGVPLVIFHSEPFLRRALGSSGFGRVTCTSVPEPRRWNRVNRPIIGLPQFVVPERLLPAMTHVLLRGTAV